MAPRAILSFIMAVMVCMLRGVNVGGHNKIKMDVLRALCESQKLRDVQTYVQSGNVVFRTTESKLGRTSQQIESAIETKLGFRPAVILRTTDEMRKVVARSPFAGRRGIEYNKLAIIFLVDQPGAEARERLGQLKSDREQLWIDNREIHIYFPDGMGRSKLPAALDRALKGVGTGRNWNTVLKLLEMAEKLEANG